MGQNPKPFAYAADSVRAHNSAKSCWVTIGNKVFDITEFLEDHPGGDDLILDYAGTDVGAIMADGDEHFHSETAYDILNDFYIGNLAPDPAPTPLSIITGVAVNGADPVFDSATSTAVASNTKDSLKPTRRVYQATGMANAEDLSRDTDTTKDFHVHRFLDLDRPLLGQVWNGGFSKQFYLDQVHRPRHYRGGASAPLFGNFLEPLSKTPWWVIPMLWVPVTIFGLYQAQKELAGPIVAGAFLLGLAVWTLIEYGMHRFLFHLDDYLPDNRCAITLHFLLHGIHHYLPMDRYRLVMPPTLLVALATPFWYLVHAIFSPWHFATAAFFGGFFGYVCYDLTHYFLHHKNLPSYYKELKKYHLEHHFADYENGFGVTSRFWDRVFGTELLPAAPPMVAESS